MTPDGAQVPCFKHAFLMQLLQEVAFFKIIQSGHCIRRLEVSALQGHVYQLRPKAWLV